MNEEPTHKQSTARLDTSTQLAHERTLMGWVRTAISLISFGFTIAKVFELLHEKHGEQATLLGPPGDRNRHDRDGTGRSGVGDNATSAGFQGNA